MFEGECVRLVLCPVTHAQFCSGIVALSLRSLTAGDVCLCVGRSAETWSLLCLMSWMHPRCSVVSCRVTLNEQGGPAEEMHWLFSPPPPPFFLCIFLRMRDPSQLCRTASWLGHSWNGLGVKRLFLWWIIARGWLCGLFSSLIEDENSGQCFLSWVVWVVLTDVMPVKKPSPFMFFWGYFGSFLSFFASVKLLEYSGDFTLLALVRIKSEGLNFLLVDKVKVCGLWYIGQKTDRAH